MLTPRTRRAHPARPNPVHFRRLFFAGGKRNTPLRLRRWTLTWVSRSLDAVAVAAILDVAVAERDLIHRNQPLQGAVCVQASLCIGGAEGVRRQRRTVQYETRLQNSAILAYAVAAVGGITRGDRKLNYIQLEYLRFTTKFPPVQLPCAGLSKSSKAGSRQDVQEK